MLKESLDETLEAAKFCSDYKKTDTKWDKFATGGCLGYPCAILLFSLVDTIGSYFRKNSDFKILIDGKQEIINAAGWEHFKILNSKYYNQNLSKQSLKLLYEKSRSCLIHNSVLGSNIFMVPDNTAIQPETHEKAFVPIHANSKTIHIISIKEFWELSKSAVEMFKKDIDTVVPKSKQGKNFQ
ncbi:MAG: hypothetical protein CVU12_08665 [Bacteroidetes bacterium HGW-Bacteroidetes-7]|nr:MAG: hypothetical protein CVU12_08665 [Bacteroidetes bacterium HGW-Bacteroidetes-7]